MCIKVFYPDWLVTKWSSSVQTSTVAELFPDSYLNLVIVLNMDNFLLHWVSRIALCRFLELLLSVLLSFHCSILLFQIFQSLQTLVSEIFVLCMDSSPYLCLCQKTQAMRKSVFLFPFPEIPVPCTAYCPMSENIILYTFIYFI